MVTSNFIKNFVVLCTLILTSLFAPASFAGRSGYAVVFMLVNKTSVNLVANDKIVKPEQVTGQIDHPFRVKTKEYRVSSGQTVEKETSMAVKDGTTLETICNIVVKTKAKLGHFSAEAEIKYISPYIEQKSTKLLCQPVDKSEEKHGDFDVAAVTVAVIPVGYKK